MMHNHDNDFGSLLSLPDCNSMPTWQSYIQSKLLIHLTSRNAFETLHLTWCFGQEVSTKRRLDYRTQAKSYKHWFWCTSKSQHVHTISIEKFDLVEILQGKIVTYLTTIFKGKLKQSLTLRAQKTASRAATSVIVCSLSLTMRCDVFPCACFESSWYRVWVHAFISCVRSWNRCATFRKHCL